MGEYLGQVIRSRSYVKVRVTRSKNVSDVFSNEGAQCLRH